MQKRTKVFNLIVLDESGSMGMIAESTLSNLKEIFESMTAQAAKFPEQEHSLSLFSFNSNGIKELISDKPISECQAMSLEDYSPQAMTPLYDAMMIAFGKIRELQKNNDGSWVNAAIITDGYENASKEIDRQQLKNLVGGLREKKWEICYYGANHDVEEVSRGLNINRSVSFEANDSGLNVVKERVSHSHSRICYSISGIDFDKDPNPLIDFKKSEGKKNEAGS